MHIVQQGDFGKGKVIAYKWNEELKRVDVHNPTLDLYCYKVSVSTVSMICI